ncbi:putative phage tail protein [Pararoseomonas sp. SCSIO 73927]|uniref:YmfQ family protein n=1 Tax=Pararoseomonas sp. SCSIO 73927 TaxID=3114537 RepID=UPI0030D4CE43
MSHTREDHHAQLQGLLPPGRAMASGEIGALLAPFASELAWTGERAAALLEELDPRTATEMLPDFERVLGPDPCGRDGLGLDMEGRRAIAHQRWTTRGGASIAFFVDLAAKLGVAITIEESEPTVCGEAECGDELTPEDEIFVWTVHLPLEREIEAECGVTECGDFLGEFAPNLVECVIRDLAPAHTTVVFSYEAT